MWVLNVNPDPKISIAQFDTLFVTPFRAAACLALALMLRLAKMNHQI